MLVIVTMVTIVIVCLFFSLERVIRYVIIGSNDNNEIMN